MFQRACLVASFVFVGCSSSSPSPSSSSVPADAGADSSPEIDGSAMDASQTMGSQTMDGGGDDSNAPSCSITAMDVACPTTQGPPKGSTCKQLTITSCPGIESDTIQATVATLEPTGTAKGTILHLIGGGGQGWETTGVMQYANEFRQVFVSWGSDWEQTTSAGIRAGASRPSAVFRWVFEQIHKSDRTLAFCGQGHSGGSGQLGYALAHYGMGDTFDYVNEISGPPFSRIDLGCDGDAPSTAMVCGDTVTTRLPSKLDNWLNNTLVKCGDKNVPPTDLDRWKADSVAFGGVYDYPRTDVEFYDCTAPNATAVTAMAQIYEQLIAQTEGMNGMIGYHCYSQAGGCTGESISPKGQMDAIDSMLSGCKPRH